jgi:regulator of protease activity HflC (stomatin/prohibitin superfamily)
MGPESFLGAMALMVFGYLIGSVRIVEEGDEALVQRLGQYQRTLKPGLNFVVPLVDTVLIETMREQTLDTPPQDVVTKDKASIKVDAIIFWRVLDLYNSYYGVEELENSLKNLVQGALRNKIGQMDLGEVISSIDKINSGLKQEIEKATEAWGVQVTRVEIQKFELPQTLRDALDRQAAAKAEGQAELTRTQTAVKSIQDLSEALASSADPQKVLQFLIAEKYVASNLELSKSDNTKILFMNPQNLNESITDLIVNRIPSDRTPPNIDNN